ncbi:MAG: putative quinol monooxygenase [Candidatus Dormibacteraceae bacterium]
MSAVEFAHITSVPGQGDKFEEQLIKSLEVINESPQNHEIVVYRCIENPDQFRLLVTWDSVEAHLAWRDGEGRARYRAFIDDLLAGPIEVSHFTEVARK